MKINIKKALEIITNENGEVLAEKCFKENGKLEVKEEKITFADFLVNPGETATQKYGKILQFIIDELNK